VYTEIVDDYQSSQLTSDGMPPQQRVVKPLLIAVAIILVCVLAAVAAFLFIKHRHTPVTPVTTTATSQLPVPDTTVANTTAQYVSNGSDLNLSFVYPSAWTVVPSSNNNTNDQTISATSPPMSLTNTSGNAVVGKVVVQIRPGRTSISELSSGNAAAAQDSIQIAYQKPTANQRQYPYITFIHLAGGSNPSNAFEEVMITGNMTFAKSQTVTALSLTQLDPIISATFYTCTTKDCTGTGITPLDITNDTWQTSDLGQQVLALFQSIQLQ
jgi:hypothetical protein